MRAIALRGPCARRSSVLAEAGRELVVALEDLGEFGLIARLTAGLGRSPRVRVGVGDDAAVLECEGGTQMVVTCDALVEGSHFIRRWAPADQIGRRALAVNLSDVAAMGGVPVVALLSLVLPRDTEVEWLDGLYAGLRGEAEAFGVAIVGGNVATTSGPLIIDVTLLGQVAAGRALLRSGARPGDRLCVTGTVGAAAAGLLTMARSRGAPPSDAARAVARVRAALLAPRPRVAEGRALAAGGAVTAAIDVSDGLAGDLGHLCEQSGVGVIVETAALPILEETRLVARHYGSDPVDLALYGGEDYELLFTVRPEAVDETLAAVRGAGGTATVIGTMTEATDGLRLRSSDGMVGPLEPRGWDHLRGAEWTD
jgi:thiamine-monophosphate kinase